MSKLCFVIAPIGDEGSEVRRRSDQVLKYVIEIAAKECGYETLRADKISAPGMINFQIIQHLLDDPLLIADLTGHNANVFYELAIRHVIRKPVIQLIAKEEQIPFDLIETRTVRLDYRDLESVENCRQQLVSLIRTVEKEPTDADSPISIAIDLQTLKRSENPVEKSAAQIMSMLESLHAKVDSLVGLRGDRGTDLEIERQSNAVSIAGLLAQLQMVYSQLSAEKEPSKRASLEETAGELKNSLEIAKIKQEILTYQMHHS